MKHTLYNGVDHVFIRPGELVESSTCRTVFTDTTELQLVESPHREIVPGNTPFLQRLPSFVDDLRNRRIMLLAELRASKKKKLKLDKGPAGPRSPRKKKEKVSDDDLMTMIALKLAEKAKEKLDVKSI